MPKRAIVRSPNGGERVRLWLNAPLQRLLRRLAAERGITLSEAVRVALAEWAEDQRVT